MRNLETRIIGIILLISGLIYISWLHTVLNLETPLFSLFVLLTAYVGFISSIFLVINNWSWSQPKPKSLSLGQEPKVAIIVPTWKEPVQMVSNTVTSILNQNFPKEKMVLIISDDDANPEMHSMIQALHKRYPMTELIYHIPEPKNSPNRVGEGKAGNLNSAMQIVNAREDIHFVETRDADDLVHDPNFLRITLAYLVTEQKLAFVQTIKDVITPKGDPFGAKQKLFYRSLMLSKNAAGAVFPCGSGLVWRKAALNDIGGFPAWNIVEDFQSGIEALRRGWKSLYVPIVGAMGQVAPEDIPNLYKQRGVWALDAMRFLFWGKKKGLSFKQLMHFIEPGFFYSAYAIYFFQAAVPILSLSTGTYPVLTDPITYFLHVTPHIIAAYLLVISLIRRQDLSLANIVRSFQIWIGLGPVYLKAFILALFWGPNKKPKYVVTRKIQKEGLFLLNVLPQLILISLAAFGMIYEISVSESFFTTDYVTILWALFYTLALGHSISISFYTFHPLKQLSEAFFGKKEIYVLKS